MDRPTLLSAVKERKPLILENNEPKSECLVIPLADYDETEGLFSCDIYWQDGEIVRNGCFSGDDPEQWRFPYPDDLARFPSYKGSVEQPTPENQKQKTVDKIVRSFKNFGAPEPLKGSTEEPLTENAPPCDRCGRPSTYTQNSGGCLWHFCDAAPDCLRTEERAEEPCPNPLKCDRCGNPATTTIGRLDADVLHRCDLHLPWKASPLEPLHETTDELLRRLHATGEFHELSYYVCPRCTNGVAGGSDKFECPNCQGKGRVLEVTRRSRLLPSNPDIVALEAERMEWSLETFKEATAVSSLEKLRGEINEVLTELMRQATVGNLREEYADCLMCLFDSAGRAGITPVEMFKAFALKLEKNKARKWEKNPDNTYSHAKGSPPTTKD